MTRFLPAMAIAACALFATAASAQDAYPNKPITIVVPFAPGGVNDFVARLAGEKLQTATGQAVQIDNKPGAGGRIAAAAVARAKPDGYTLLLMTSGSTVVAGAFQPDLEYDPIADFVPVIRIADFPLGIFGRKDLPASNIEDLVAFAKSAPGGLKISTSGSGSAGHLSAEVLMHRLGIGNAIFVHYKGEAPSMTALLAGDTDIAFAVSSPDPAIKVLATTGAKRWSAYPDVATVEEQGIEGYTSAGWAGIAAPAGTPPKAVSKLEEVLGTELKSEEAQAQIRRRGAEPSLMPGQEFHERMRAELAAWIKTRDELDLRPFN
jgi:tripartite-type tricarboxylate transporter receptor subunit TctC